MSEREVSDEAYIAAAIADRGFEVVRSSSGFDAEVRFKQPQPGYSSRGGVAVLTARAREFMPPGKQDAHERNRPDDHPPAAELPAPDPGGTEAESLIGNVCTAQDMGFPPEPDPPPKKSRKKQNRPKA